MNVSRAERLSVGGGDANREDDDGAFHRRKDTAHDRDSFSPLASRRADRRARRATPARGCRPTVISTASTTAAANTVASAGIDAGQQRLHRCGPRRMRARRRGPRRCRQHRAAAHHDPARCPQASAPSAMRTPISRTRADTVNASRPWMPMAASSSAAAANAPSTRTWITRGAVSASTTSDSICTLAIGCCGSALATIARTAGIKRRRRHARANDEILRRVERERAVALTWLDGT